MRPVYHVSRGCLLAIVTVLAATDSSYGQTIAEPETARVRLGRFGFTPKVNIASGIDTNVFNEANESKQDVTSVVSTDVAALWRIGRVRMRANGQYAYLYFQEYSAERSASGTTDFRMEIPANRLSTYAAGSYLNARERPGLEIDERVRRVSTSASAGLQFRLLSKTAIEFDASRVSLAFDAAAVAGGVSLRETLDHHSDVVNLGVRYALTPLTTARFRAETIRDRFDFLPLRDADSIRVMSGLDLGTAALISGRAFVGYRSFSPSDPAIPSFTGVVAAVGVGYTWRGTTRMVVDFNRDLNYATNPLNPYYVFNDLRGSVTQRITQAWDAGASVSRQTLNYEQRGLDPALSTIGQQDKGISYAGEIGYRANSDVRIAVDTRYSNRRGSSASRTFDGWRAGLSVTYGQ